MKPDYSNSIVNLMSSIGKKFGYSNGYSPLKQLPSRALQDTVLLIVIDGLGLEFLKTQKESFLYSHVQSSMTSVFPSTTAAAMPVYFTGVAPQQHGWTGWFMWVKALDTTIIVPPFVDRDLTPLRSVRVEDHIGSIGFGEKIKATSTIVIHKKLTKKFTRAMTKKSRLRSYTSTKGMMRGILTGVKESSFTFYYDPALDTLFHEYGVAGKKSIDYFKMVDALLEELCSQISGVTVIVSADHGLMNAPHKDILFLEDHLELLKMLRIKPCNEPRTPFLYVKKGQEQACEKYVRQHLSQYCTIKKGSELIKEGWFGKGKAYSDLKNRVGDYVLFMKKTHTLRTKRTSHMGLGQHSGISKEEMIVPLIVIQT